MGELTALPIPYSWWQGAGCPLPNNPIPAVGPSGLELRGLRPLSSRPLSSNPDEYASAKLLELSVFKLFIFTVVILGNLALNKKRMVPICLNTV